MPNESLTVSYSVANSTVRRILKKIALTLLVLCLGIAIGFVTDRYLLNKKQQALIDSLPIGLAILQNPIVNQWSGAVEGTLTAKDANSITISDQAGHTIRIAVDQSGTKFFSETSIGKPMGPEQYISHEDIPIGGKVRGSFFIIPKDGDKNRIIGSFFTYLDKSQ